MECKVEFSCAIRKANVKRLFTDFLAFAFRFIYKNPFTKKRLNSKIIITNQELGVQNEY